MSEIERLRRALDCAKVVIRNYEAEIRNSDWVGVNLAKKGFCQGAAYREAVPMIERIERGES